MKDVSLKKSWIVHFTIWLSYLLLLMWLYSESQGHEPFVGKSIFIVLVQIIVFYFNYHFLLPRLLENKKQLQYGMSILALLLVSILAFYVFDRISLELELKRAFESNDFSRLPREFRGRGRMIHHNIWSYPWHFPYIWRSLMFNGFFVVISLFISTIYRNLAVSQQKEKEALRLKSQVREAESNMLKSQINPHFLFNTLNNIYSMAQLKSDQTADAVQRLSDMLRYVIYDCNQPFVKLGQEVSYISSYIELQLLKEENMEHIKYNIGGVNKDLMIAPMLLIPFIENSFKHSHIEDAENSWIDIVLSTAGSVLTLKAYNGIPAKPVRKDTTGGVGLENVRKRLNLIYPGRHQLIITKDLDSFKVDLTITLNED